LESGKGEVYLLPSTIDHYQKVLTNLLERDRLREAGALLEFLLACSTQDGRAREEWRALYEWVRAEIGPAGLRDAGGSVRTTAGGAGPVVAGAPAEAGPETDGPDAAGPEEDESEAELLGRLVTARSREDRQYGRKLLELLRGTSAADKQLLALEQLSYLKDPELDEPLLAWLESDCRNPFVQFKAMQALRRRGYGGPIEVRRRGERIRVQASEVPLAMDDYPPAVREVLRLAERACESRSPGMAYFLEEIWSEFLSAVFGTSVYRELSGMDDRHAAVWAAALHSAAGDMIGDAPDARELRNLYGLGAEQLGAWENCCRLLREGIEGN